MNSFVVINICNTCLKDPIPVTLTFTKDKNVTHDLHRNNFVTFDDDRPGSDLSTDITGIKIDETSLVPDANGNFPEQHIVIKDSTRDYDVWVSPLPPYSDKMMQLVDRTILGVIMQDGSRDPKAKKGGKAEATTGRHFSVENKCFSCKKDPLSVVVFYEGGYPVSGSAPFGGKQNDIPDNRPNSGASTDIENIIVESQQVDQQGGLFIPTPINVKFNGKVYPVMVYPLHPKTNQNKDKTILGIEMQDGVLIEGEKKTKKKARKKAEKKAKKSGSKPVKTKKEGKKTKSKK
jgi:hypothetical protein